MDRDRKKKTIYISAFLVIVMLISLLTCGCTDENQTGQTIEEPNITVDYLAGDYANQLLRDGAEHVFGSVKLSTDENGVVTLTITAKEFVKDDDEPNGFYIADRNMEVSCPLADEARTTFLSGGTSIASILTTEEFVAAFNQDLADYGSDDPNAYLQSRYYDIYIMNGQAELVLAFYIP